ncbi:hypothetical protein GJ698_30240, partial [Pseudoduganella sp. FT26W]|nr:hypothetical protein [Duganella aquatilis]
MSYILEALKKAQAERQLGSSPTIHAPTLQAAEPASSAARFSKPMLLAVLGMAVVIGVLLVLVWRPFAPAATATTPAPQPQPQQPQPVAVQSQPVARPVPAAPTP